MGAIMWGLLMAIVFFFGNFIGFCMGTKCIKKEAIELGYGRWNVDINGDADFVWIEKSPGARG